MKYNNYNGLYHAEKKKKKKKKKVNMSQKY